MEVKLGYKQTEAGVIPEEWSTAELGSVATIERGKFSARPRNDPQYYGGAHPFLQTGDVTRSRGRISSFTQTLNDHGLSVSKIFPRRTLFFTISANIGDVGIANFEAACPDSLVAISPRYGNKKEWLLYELASHKEDFEKLASPGAQLNINLEKLRPFLLPVPPLSEQCAIANALSDTDSLLDGLDRLIAKKRAIKLAAMQQLLTGETRLPGFSREWEVKRLGDHLNFLKNGVNSRAELTCSEKVRYLHYGDIHGSSQVMLNPSSVEMPCLPPCKASRLDRLQDGDLIYADASEDIDGIGKSVEIVGTKGVEVVSGLHTIAIRFDKDVLADGFKAYIQFIPEFRTHLRQLAAGTKVYATNRAHITSAELRLPGVDEQQAISVFLTDMAAEIAAIEACRTKTRALKQAMMQELLTGRTRLV